VTRSRRAYRVRPLAVAAALVAGLALAPAPRAAGSAPLPTTVPIASAQTSVAARTGASTDVRRAGAWFVDGRGRALVMHGFDIVHKTDPWLPEHVDARDARFLGSEGFDVARIGLAWSAVEPRPGVYDDAYLTRFIRFERLLARYGIRSLVDVHQDLWSTQNMPPWATPGTTYADNFQAFWDDAPANDGVGIQTHFLGMWQHVAARLRDEDGVLALDPFNEPQAGLDSACAPFAPCPAFEAGALSDFYDRYVAALRRIDPTRLVLLEPLPDPNLLASSIRLPHDPQVGTTFHEYCTITQTATSSGPQDQACDPIEQTALDTQVDQARQSFGVPTFVGEWSSNDADDDNAHMVDLMSQRFLSWTMWQYYTYAQDPANTPGQGLLLDDAKHGSQANAKQAKLDAVAVPYARAIAGTPRATSFDRDTGRLVLGYATAAVPGARLRSRTTELFLPRRVYPDGYRVHVRHGSLAEAGRRVLRVRSDAGVTAVRVVVTRR